MIYLKLKGMYKGFSENKDLKKRFILGKNFCMIFFLGIFLYELFAVFALYQKTTYNFFTEPLIVIIFFIFALLLTSFLILITIKSMTKNKDELKLSIELIKKIIVPIFAAIAGFIVFLNILRRKEVILELQVVMERFRNADKLTTELTDDLSLIVFLIIVPATLVFIVIIFEFILWLNKPKKSIE